MFTQKNLVVDTLNGREFSYEVTLLEMAAKELHLVGFFQAKIFF